MKSLTLLLLDVTQPGEPDGAAGPSTSLASAGRSVRTVLAPRFSLYLG
jgi:hypothetical protein